MNHLFQVTCGSLLFTSCNPSSKDDIGINDSLFVQTLSYTSTEGNENNHIQDQYDYEGSFIVRRTETHLNSGKAMIFAYTYSGDLISEVEIYNENDDLESEINIYYNENNQVSSYEYTGNLNTNSPTYSLATFTYTANQILHCDGKHWSSVEYKDVYDNVFLYTTNEDGNIVEIDEIVDCYFSASTTTNGLEVEIEYDDHYSPFSNINGNNLILDDVIGIFTDSIVRGFYNNTTRLTELLNGEQETQIWVNEYNDVGYPITIQWSDEANREDVEIVYY